MPPVLRIFIVALWLVPLRFLMPFMAIALYSGPETDDYCLSAHDPWAALAHIHQYYVSVSGRLPALLLMATPSLIARQSDMDFVVLYSLFNFGVICCLIAAMVISAWQLIRSDRAVNVLFGLILSAAVISLSSDLHEFIYWLTGSACYLIPTLGCALVVTRMAAAIARGEVLTRGAFVAVALICLVCSASNEFTGLFLAGVILLSWGFQYFALGRKRVQVGMHALLLAIIAAGFALVALAPGSGARMTQFARSRDVPFAIETVLIYVPEYLNYLASLPALGSAMLSALCFGYVAAWPSAPPSRITTLLFVAALVAMTMIWVCAAYFVGGYATGELIPLRARNEVWAIVEVAGMIAGALAIGAIVQNWVPPLARPVIAGIGVAVALSLGDAPASERVGEEWPQLSTFWRETLQRHFLLMTTKADDVVVPNRSVRPSLLMGEEVKPVPDRLPNDCVAAFYGKRSVVLAP